VLDTPPWPGLPSPLSLPPHAFAALSSGVLSVARRCMARGLSYGESFPVPLSSVATRTLRLSLWAPLSAPSLVHCTGNPRVCNIVPIPSIVINVLSLLAASQPTRRLED
jgi:hypothetical protein